MEEKPMNEYTRLHTQISVLETQKKMASKRGSKTLEIGFLALGVSLVTWVLFGATGFISSDVFWVAVLGSGFLVLLGIFEMLRGRSQAEELSKEIEGVQAQLTPLEEERANLLASIRVGNLDILPSFEGYVFQELPIDLLPSRDKLMFRPQKEETCFVQINDVDLGRLKTRTVMRKTGGGYRVGRIYVPVQKERVQVTEMNNLDTGTLAITNRRVLYLGAVRKLSIKLDKILELEAYQDALSITKEGRQSADFFLNVDGELLTAIIEGIESKPEG